MVGKYALICVKIQKTQMVVHIFTGFASFKDIDTRSEEHIKLWEKSATVEAMGMQLGLMLKMSAGVGREN